MQTNDFCDYEQISACLRETRREAEEILEQSNGARIVVMLEAPDGSWREVEGLVDYHGIPGTIIRGDLEDYPLTRFAFVCFP